MTPTLRLYIASALLTAGLASVVYYHGEPLQELQPPAPRSSPNELVSSPPEARAVLWRVRWKIEVIRKLRKGEITLFEAAASFRHLNANPPGQSSTSWMRMPGDSANEKVCRQVLFWVGGHLDDNLSEGEVEELVRRLEEDLQRQLAEHGSVTLPGWAPEV